ncbi:MAG: rhodanese-related sulfurtransferase [Chlamydiales bacterium]|nr:rhodanese-related sulfurtransferase [Chlamydiia bacterium]MCP5506938.1 rhodanese-related sulfurtransferase [Chlamydiales bacterium]
MTEKQLPYLVLAYYYFTAINDPHEEVRKHKEFFADRDVTSRIYISSEGINGQMSASRAAAKEYQEWMSARPEFAGIVFKEHEWHEHAFPRVCVKYRKQLVAIDKEYDLANGGEHISPEQWKAMLESEDRPLMIDVRNDYESEVGHFEGAELPKCNTFREFDHYTDELCQRTDPKNTPVMMYCTGGIRCELYSAVLKDKGFDKVYQLDGGVINYGLKAGSKHWLGKLFVFDDRMTVPISEENTPTIGKCHLCGDESEDYYNCANMDCNHLFLCCSACLEKNKGCCCDECTEAPRIRPYSQQNPHKPFRKYYNYFERK